MKAKWNLHVWDILWELNGPRKWRWMFVCDENGIGISQAIGRRPYETREQAKGAAMACAANLGLEVRE